MTREEVIKRLKEIDIRDALQEDYDALYTAIEELEQEPCEDAISRQEVIDEIEFFQINPQHFDFVSLIDNIKDLPSVRPQEKTGHWIEVIDEIDSLGNKTWHHKCSICGNEDSGWGNYKYCPQCGAKMQEAEIEG